MNPTLVLVLLLLAVPLQLFFNHYLEQSYSAEESAASVGAPIGGPGGVNGARVNALENLSATARIIKHQFRATLRHYSSWKNVLELFVIPHKKVRKTNTLRVRSFKTQGGKKVKIITQSSSTQTPTKSATSQSSVQTSRSKTAKEAPTSQAKEVEDYMMKEVYFAQSKTPRTKRPSNVHYSVGQIVQHKGDGFHGVIIGWDPVVMAPDWWLEKFYSKERQVLPIVLSLASDTSAVLPEHVIATPHYHILVDTHFVSGTPYYYIPAEDLVSANKQVTAPELDNFFEGFQDGKYIPRPWLKNQYPHD